MTRDRWPFAEMPSVEDNRRQARSISPISIAGFNPLYHRWTFQSLGTVLKTFSLLAFLSVAAASSAIVLEPTSIPRSGLVRIRGNGFGSGGQVRIGTQAFPIARWSDSLIECYVPGGAPLGSQIVQVLPKSGATGGRVFASATILAQEPPSGRLTWRLKLADQYVSTRPVIGPDGTIYALGNFGRVYAVSPQGQIKWVSPANAAGTLGVLPDGNIVVGGGGGVQSLNAADGSRRWVFPINTPLLCGPSVGPDGNVYAADDSRWSNDVIGAFVLNPAGQKLWSGGIFYRRGGGWTPQEVQFGGGNAYFWSDYSTTGGPALGGLNAMFLGGNLRWRADDGVGIYPGAAPNGGVAFFRPSTIDMSNAQGSPIWSQNLNQFGGQPQGEATVAADGRTYFLTSNGRLNVISPTGQVLFSSLLGGMLSDQVIRPDGNMIALESQPNFGVASQIRGYDKNLNQLWSQGLPIDNGTTITVYQRMIFGGTGETLYFGTAGPYTAADEAHCYLYALDAR